MKKISFYMMALLTTILAACGDDYSVSTPPQTNPQESALSSSAITFNSIDVGSINLRSLIENDTPISLGTVTVAEGVPSDAVHRGRQDQGIQGVHPVARVFRYGYGADRYTKRNDQMLSHNLFRGLDKSFIESLCKRRKIFAGVQ